MKNETKRIKRTNQALKGLFFEGSLLGEIANIMDVAKNQFDQIMSQIKLIMVEWLLSADRESLLEGQEELLTVHRLEVPTLLRESLYSTNSIESMLSQVSHLRGGLKNMKGGKQMARRWVGSNLLEAEKSSELSKNTCQ